METTIMNGGYIGFRLGTAPTQCQLDNILIWLYTALNRTPNIDCEWVGAVPKV